MKRREFLGTASSVIALATAVNADFVPIIDTHIHLFDTRRPGGIPWPPKEDGIVYQRTLPDRFRSATSGLGVVGAIAIECSPVLEDNQWVLDVASGSPIIVGTVGNLEPAQPDFLENLERFRENPLYRGLRYGNLWGRDLSDRLSEPQFVSHLQVVANAGLALDTANPNPRLISAVVKLADKIPDLRVVIDHLPQLELPAEAKTLTELRANLQELGKRPQVYVKISEVPRRVVDGEASDDLNLYKPRLDEFWDIFGPDRLIYGSDWPNSDHWRPYPKVLNLVQRYFFAKGPEAAQKFFWKNSIAAYRWVKREPNQPYLP
jgi:predicted TIM-barrel fold metal-dependent hydrolase